MPVKHTCHIVRVHNNCQFLFIIFVFVINPQTSLLLDNGHPKQDKSPKEGGLKNGDIDVDLSQLKLDDKGQYKNIFLVLLPESK